MAAVVVGSLVAQIEDELETVVERIGDRIREEIPDFRRLPKGTLAQAVRGNVSRARWPRCASCATRRRRSSSSPPRSAASAPSRA